DPAVIHQIKYLYESGLCLQAFRVAEPIEPFQDCVDFDARLILGRLAPNIGASKLGQLLHLKAYKQQPHNPEARYYYARVVLDRHGPRAAWETMAKIGELEDADADLLADWRSFHAIIAGLFRDFETAELWMARAMETAAENPWIWVERSTLYE